MEVEMMKGFVARLSEEEKKAFSLLLEEGFDSLKVSEREREMVALVLEETLRNGG